MQPKSFESDTKNTLPSFRHLFRDLCRVLDRGRAPCHAHGLRSLLWNLHEILIHRLVHCPPYCKRMKEITWICSCRKELTMFRIERHLFRDASGMGWKPIIAECLLFFFQAVRLFWCNEMLRQADIEKKGIQIHLFAAHIFYFKIESKAFSCVQTLSTIKFDEFF